MSNDETRVLPAQPQTITLDWRLGSTSTAPSNTTTLAITRPDGTALPGAPATAPSTANPSRPGEVGFVLPAQAEVTRLKVVWTATVGGQVRNLTTYVEVVGAHLFDLADLRAFKWGGFTSEAAPLADATKYPDERLQEVRDLLLDEFEDFTGTPFVERYTSAIVQPIGRRLWLDLKLPRRVLSLKDGATVWTSLQIGALAYGEGFLELPDYARFYGSVVLLEYVRGLYRVPPPISEAAKKVAVHKLAPSRIPPRAITVTDERGTMQLSVANPGRQRYYGLPEVDAILGEYDLNALEAVG